MSLYTDLTIVLWVISLNLVFTGIYFFFIFGEPHLISSLFAFGHTILIFVKLILFIYIILFLKRLLKGLYRYYKADTLLTFLILLNILISYFTVRGLLSPRIIWQMYPVMIAINFIWGLSIIFLGINVLRIPEPVKIWRNLFGINLILAGLLYASYYLAIVSFLPAVLADLALLRMLWLVRKRLVNS